MNEQELIRILLPWNFWGKKLNTGVQRKQYVDEALSYLKTNKIITIVGMRRAGKSYMARQIAKSFKEKNSLIVNFEESRFDEELDKGFLNKIYDSYLALIKPDKKPLVILDEIQEVSEWEKFVRSISEKEEASVIITGSSARIMSEELATLLTGRTLTLKVFPLSFTEFLLFKNIQFSSTLEAIKKQAEVKQLFSEYCSFGGLPEVVLEDNPELKMKILDSYYRDIISKDIVRRFGIRRIDKLERIAFHYVTNFSSSITFNSIGKFLKLEEKTVEIYSNYIEQSKLIFFVRRYSSSVKEQENSPRKVYLTDVGFHNLSNILQSDKISKIYENLVAIHLLRREGDNVVYWKDNSGREVDFVVKKGPKIAEAIQVSHSFQNEETKKRELRSLLKVLEESRLNEGLIITEGYEKDETYNNKRIRFIPLWKWLSI